MTFTGEKGFGKVFGYEGSCKIGPCEEMSSSDGTEKSGYLGVQCTGVEVSCEVLLCLGESDETVGLL
jgi:hypothetical protein